MSTKSFVKCISCLSYVLEATFGTTYHVDNIFRPAVKAAPKFIRYLRLQLHYMCCFLQKRQVIIQGLLHGALTFSGLGGLTSALTSSCFKFVALL